MSKALTIGYYIVWACMTGALVYSWFWDLTSFESFVIAMLYINTSLAITRATGGE